MLKRLKLKAMTLFSKYLASPVKLDEELTQVLDRIRIGSFNEALFEAQFAVEMSNGKFVHKLRACTWRSLGGNPQYLHALEKYARWLARRNERLGHPVKLDYETVEDITLEDWFLIQDTLNKLEIQKITQTPANPALRRVVLQTQELLPRPSKTKHVIKLRLPSTPNPYAALALGPSAFISALGLNAKNNNVPGVLAVAQIASATILGVSACIAAVGLIGKLTFASITSWLMVYNLIGAIALKLATPKEFIQYGSLLATIAPESWQQAADSDTLDNQHFRLMYQKAMHAVCEKDLSAYAASVSPAEWQTLALQLVGRSSEDEYYEETDRNNAIKLFRNMIDNSKSTNEELNQQFAKSFRVTAQHLTIKEPLL